MPDWSRRSFLRTMSLIAGTLWQSRVLARTTIPVARLSSQAHTLWYRAPAREWVEALPVGNGRLGGMIFGDPHCERILLNQETFWSGKPRAFRPPNAPTFLPLLRDLLIAQDGPRADQVVRERLLSKIGESYQPLGFLELRHESKSSTAPSEYRRALDLRDGIHSVECTDPQGGTRLERIFASAPDQILAVRLSNSQPGALHFTARFGSTTRNPVVVAEQGVLRMEVQAPVHVIQAEVDNANAAVTWDTPKKREAIRATVAMCVVDQTGPQGSRCSVTADGIRIEGATSVTLLVSAATSYAGPQLLPGEDATGNALSTLHKARQCGADLLEKQHLADHRSLFDRAYLDFGDSGAPDFSMLPTNERLLRAASANDDPGLSALYFQMGRYLLMASSRPGSLPATTQGIWSHRMRPQAEAHWALNADLETTYSLAEVANLAECHEPLFAFTERLSRDGAETASRIYGAGGWVAHTTADLWCSTVPDAGGSTAAIWKSGGAWLCLHLWEHYQFSGDRAFLRAYYPLMRGASQFFLDHMRGDWDGWLAMYPESSFENSYSMPSGGVALSAYGPSMSTSIVRELFLSTAAAADVLGIDDLLQVRLQATLQQLRPLAVQPKTGELQEWANADWLPADSNTDQLPQIWALNPGTQIDSVTTPELAQAAHTSLLKWSPWLRNSGGPLTSLYAGALARLGNSEAAYDLLREHLGAAVHPSLLAGDCASGGELRIGGNAGMAASIAEMLLQSHAGEVHFLPALPQAWSNGSFRGFRARGGLEIDLEWHAAHARKAVLRASLEGVHVLRAPRNQRIAALTGAAILERLSPDRLSFHSKPGGVYSITFA